MADCEAVELWRRQYHLNLSKSWKRDVEITVKDIDLWKSILRLWKLKKWHPGSKNILTEYERREFDAIQPEGSGVHSEESLSERAERRMPERFMPALYAGEKL